MMLLRSVATTHVRWMWKHIHRVQLATSAQQQTQSRATGRMRLAYTTSDGGRASYTSHVRSLSTSLAPSSEPVSSTQSPPVQSVLHENAQALSADKTPTPTSTSADPIVAPSVTPSPSVSPSMAPSSSPASTPSSLHPGYLISDQSVFLSDGKQATINELLKDKRVLLLGYVAAYTRLCQQSLSAYAHKAAELKKKHHIDHIYAIAVNDHAVLTSFAASLSITSNAHITLIADYDARLTRWLGMEVDLTSVGFGLRSQRYAMLVDHQQIKWVRVEPNVGTLEATSVENIIKLLNQEKKDKEEKDKQQQHQHQHQQQQPQAGHGESPVASSNKPAAAAPAPTDAPLNEAEAAQRIPPLVQ